MRISLYSVVCKISANEVFVCLKKSGKILTTDEVDLYPLDLYKDYVFLPHIDKTVVYDAFLDHYHLDKVKRLLHEQEDFTVAFRIFSENSWEYHMDIVRNFEMKYLKPLAEAWCRKNNLSFIDDVPTWGKEKIESP